MSTTVYLNSIYCAAAPESMYRLDDDSIDCIITSPMYYRQRKVDIEGEIGWEKTTIEYLGNLASVFREAKRVLRPTGTMHIVIADSYKNGEPLGIPDRLIEMLRLDGWVLRHRSIWFKTNSMPESVNNRPVRSHEYVLMFAKSRSPKFWTRVSDGVGTNVKPGYLTRMYDGKRVKLWEGHNYYYDWFAERKYGRRDVWDIPTIPLKGAHYAPFPASLVERILLVNCPQQTCPVCGMPFVRRVAVIGYENHGGLRKRADAPGSVVSPTSVFRTGKTPIYQTVGWSPTCECDHNDLPVPGRVLDMFCGYATVGVVARQFDYDYILSDISDQYVAKGKERVMKGLNSDDRRRLAHLITDWVQPELLPEMLGEFHG